MDSIPIFPSRKRSISTAFGSNDADNNDTTSAYNVESEVPPSQPFHSPAFQDVLRKGLNIPRQLADALEKAQLSLVDGDNIQRLISDAQGLSKFEVSDTRTIAILGDSGGGEVASN